MTEPKLVLVTGASGFIGRYVVHHFAKMSWSVVGIGKSSPENAPLSNLKAYHCLELPNNIELNKLLAEYRPDVLIHCAGRASVDLSMTMPKEDFATNAALTFDVLNSLRTCAPECKFVFLSSAAVYGNPKTIPVSETQEAAPISPYGFHKWQSEQLLLEFAKVYGLATASIRIFSAYGAGLRRQVVWDICRKVIQENSLILRGTGTESRDFIHAIDVAKAIEVVATKAPMVGEVYNLGSGEETTIKHIANLAVDALGYDCVPQFDGSVPSGIPLNWKADISKLQSLGFEPAVPLDKGVQAFANWCKAELYTI